ncbi:MAG: hemolysin III family protein [Pirellulales bacterium]|nr:hemolysin III family protein [Pirellulales bacterium]
MGEIAVYGIPGFREPFACLSHLIAAGVFAIVGVSLVRRGRGSRCRTASLAVLVFSTVFLLSMSAVYHMLDHGQGRYVMRSLDVAGVFVLIAGTATPLLAILFRGWYRWLPLVCIWAFAATGITLRVIFEESMPKSAGTAIFLVLGWIGAIPCIVLWRRYGYRFVEPLLWGGVAYTVGALLIVFRWPVLIPGVIGYHELWHVAVLIGITLHWKFVFQFAAGFPLEVQPIQE